MTLYSELQLNSHKLECKERFAIQYRDSHHSDIPHIVKFSGGRSSGMMLLKLLEDEILKPARGDVVIFNNTSAEHPKTYEFVKKCKDVCEREYGVPFFIIEHCTYEDAYQGDYIRMSTFRIANSEPYSEKNLNGYRWRGEIYEELLSWNGVLPSIFQRTCTIALKLTTTRNFLKDWFLNLPTTKRRGHYGDSSRIDQDALFRRHMKNRGEVPKKIFLEKKKFLLSQVHCRESQHYNDYSSVFEPFKNEIIQSKIDGDFIKFGYDDVQYIGLVGLRADEKHRVEKVLLRSASSRDDNQYSGEHVYAPLYEANCTVDNVIHFWKNQDWDLELDPKAQLSNCTFCFLKGAENLKSINAHFQEKNDPQLVDSPCDLNWWVKIEEKYAKDFVAEGKETRKHVPDNLIGFFGAKSGYFYKYIASNKQDSRIDADYPAGYIPCDCTE